jgi:chromate transporter
MHRYLVGERHWLTDGEFSASITLAQAAPGPNVLFVALMGWNVGIHAAGGITAGTTAWMGGFLGMCLAMLGCLLPSTTLTFVAARWGHSNRELRAVRAFKTGMAPVVIGLIGATGWLLATSDAHSPTAWHRWLLSAGVAVLVWKSRVHLLWLLAAGALLGAIGWV